jgi:protein-tyrosine phosphatase/arsenate reductase
MYIRNYPRLLLCLLLLHLVTDFSMLANESSADTPRFSALLRSYIESVQQETNLIADERKEQLNKIARFVQAQRAAKEPVQLMFICTHNSRRSHTAQIWAQTMAAYYGVSGVQAFSAGTEVTAFNERAVKALQRVGFTIAKVGDGTNPVYSVQFAQNAEPMKAFSKVIADASNPKQSFCAVMTCSQAEAACPFVAGATQRVSTPYDDPKNFDGTPEETAKYDERCRQIAREMAYVFAQVRK